MKERYNYMDGYLQGKTKGQRGLCFFDVFFLRVFYIYIYFKRQMVNSKAIAIIQQV